MNIQELKLHAAITLFNILQMSSDQMTCYVSKLQHKMSAVILSSERKTSMMGSLTYSLWGKLQ